MTETTLENAAVEKIFGERKDFIIIGLTGRTGCGCTTVANLLSEKFDQLQPPFLKKALLQRKGHIKLSMNMRRIHGCHFV